MVGWSQEQLSEYSSISVRTIRNLETGAIQNPRRTSVELLFNALRSATPHSEFSLSIGAIDDPVSRLGSFLETDLLVTAVEIPENAVWVGLRPKSDVTVGRRSDLTQVVAAVQRSRLLVLTGPVGVGKTRLALEAAARLLDQFPDGVVVAELGLLTPEIVDPQAAAAEVGRVLNATIPVEAGPDDRRTLLVIDDVGHVLSAVTPWVQRLLTRYPGLHILMTSLRAPTTVPAEVWEVTPLPVDQPDGPSNIPAAAELFRRRAQAAVPTLDLGDRMVSVLELCRRLGGLPLAIETAAFRIRSIPLETMLAKRSILPILEQNGVGGLSHHRSMRQSVEWAYGLLEDRQRRVLHLLARLPEEFSIDEALDSTSADHQADVGDINVLAGLVDDSAVQVKRGCHYVYEVPKLMCEYVNTLSA
ncbi:helix-turn-helix domain-containing protein [Nocardia sp. NPDC051756]|uniref:helix-turn-helix domain-containing protein n=1 Tax=Nocardia sp. NPDC051756 TaxID=3154751 RepID=UPI0034136209